MRKHERIHRIRPPLFVPRYQSPSGFSGYPTIADRAADGEHCLPVFTYIELAELFSLVHLPKSDPLTGAAISFRRVDDFVTLRDIVSSMHDGQWVAIDAGSSGCALLIAKRDILGSC